MRAIIARIRIRSALSTFMFSAILASCANNAITPSILFPESGAEFSEDVAVTFRSDYAGAWNSDLDGDLGEGDCIRAMLNAGEHLITLTCRDGASSSIRIKIRKESYRAGGTRMLVPISSKRTLSLPAGGYAPVFVSWHANPISLSVTMDPVTSNANRPVRVTKVPPRSTIRMLEPAFMAPKAKSMADNLRPSVYLDATAHAQPGDVRAWRMADPSLGTSEPGFSMNAHLMSILGNVEIWIDDDYEVDTVAYEEFLRLGVNIALSRAISIWGEREEPDGDKRLAILLSGKLNDGGSAIGFFNPCDFFPFSEEASSAEYNPTSNYRDVVYLGLPVQDDMRPAFSPASISATLAHEYQHLLRFSKKTWIQIQAGEGNALQEDTAFDEGMAHLTESLVGLGYSGGNALFALRYLQSTSSYSLRYEDIDGNTDSTGKRGGNALFMAWLLEKAGGIRWSGSEPLTAEGNGLAFLRNGLRPGSDGWTSLEGYFKISAQSLFREYCLSMNRQFVESPNVPMHLDPLTGEPTALNAFMGDFVFGQDAYCLSGPIRSSLAEATAILPWSVIFSDEFSMDRSSNLTAYASPDPGGMVLLAFLMPGP